MKTKLRKFGAWLMAAALAFAGAGAYGATKTLDVSGIAAGGVLEITEAGTYQFPNLPNNITLKATVEGVVFDCNGSGSIASVPNGAKLEGLSFVFGNNNYHGWQHAGLMEFTNCSFDGLFFSYGDLRFEKCAFVQTTGEYLMWLYANKTDFVDCTFKAQGKFFNIYNEGNATHGPWPISFDGCTFSSSKSNKAALNVKATCGATPMLYDVTVDNCKIDPSGDNFPTASVSDKLIVFNGLIQLDDISVSVPNEITITQDGKVLYADNAVAGPEVAIEEPTKEEVVAKTKGEATGGQKEEKAEEVVAVIAKAAEEETLEVGKSGLSAAGKTADGKLADPLVTALKDAAGEEKKAEITNETKVKKTIDVVFKGMTVEAGDKVTTTKIAYDVTPKATVTLSGDVTVSAKIPNGTFGKINFRMPLTADFAGRWLKVSRTDDGTTFVDVGLYQAQKDGNVDFVQVDGDHFTTYVNEISDVTPVASINGKGYVTLQEAVDAAKAGETVKLLCDIEQADDLILLEKNIAIDFADKKLLVKTGIRVLSDVTFRNGTLDLSGATGSGHGGNTAHPGGNQTSIWTMNAHLTLDGMTFSAVDVQAAYMVEMSAPSTIDFKDSVVSLDGINIGFWLNPNCGIRIEDSQVSVKHMRGGSGSGFIYGSDYSTCSLDLVNSSVTVSDSVAGAKAKGITLCGPMTVEKSTIVGKDLNNCLIQYCTPVLTDGSSITMDNTDGIEQSSLTVNAGCSVIGVGTGSKDHFGYTQLPGSVLKAGAIVNVDEITFYYNAADLTVEAGADVTVRTKLDVSSAIPQAGSVKIAGGKYNNLVQAGSTKRLDLTGGLYKVKPADGYVNSFYEAVANTNETTKAEGYEWMVVPKPSVAEMFDASGESIGKIYSLQLAFDQVPENGKVELLLDTDEDVTLTRKEGFTFVTNGKNYTGTITPPEGYEMKATGEGTFVFRKTPLFEVWAGETLKSEHYTLAEALAAVQDGETVRVLKSGNVVTEYTKQIGGDGYSEAVGANRLVFGLPLTDGRATAFTLDLNGNELCGRINFTQGDMTVRNGKLRSSSQALNVYGSKDPAWTNKVYTSITAENDVLITAGTYGFGVFGGDVVTWMFPIGFGEVVNIKCEIRAVNGALQVSGNVGMDTYETNIGKSADAEAIIEATGKKPSELMTAFGPLVNVYDGAVLGVALDGTTDDSPQAISIQGCGRVNILGGTLSGAEAIGVKGGVLNVSGGKIIGLGPKCNPVLAINSGTENSGAAIAVSTSYNANYPISVTITGGMIESQNNAAFLVAHSHESGKPVKVTQGITASVSGGTFMGGKDQSAILVEPILEGEEGKYPANFISAKLDEEGKEMGYPLCNSPIPAEYIAVGYKEKDNENKTWTVTAVSQEIVIKPEDAEFEEKTYVNDQGQTMTPTEPEKTAADKAVKEVETVYQEQVLTKVEGTGIAGAAVETPTQPGEQPKLKPSVVDALNASPAKPEDVTIVAEDGSNSWSHLVIKLKSTTTKVVTETATIKTSVNEMKVDVKPVIEVTPIKDGVAQEPFETEMPQEAIPPEGITFPLFVSEAFRGKWALVKHAGDLDYETEVLEDEKNRPFVVITATHFSEFTLLVLEASSKAVKRATDGKLYDTFAEAIADTTTAADETFTLLKDTEEVVKLGAKQTIVTGGHTFGGIDPEALDEGWTEPVNTDGKVFIAPVKANVPVSDETDAPFIRVRMRAEGATSSEDNVTKLKTPQSNQRPLWQNMALGVANDFRLIPMIPRSAIGFKTIKICSNLDDATLAAAAKQRDGVAVKFQLLKKVGAGDYVQCGEVQDKPVFNVEADELEPRTFWKIQTIFSEEY